MEVRIQLQKRSDGSARSPSGVELAFMLFGSSFFLKVLKSIIEGRLTLVSGYSQASFRKVRGRR